jgi:hypothetical protein
MKNSQNIPEEAEINPDSIKCKHGCQDTKRSLAHVPVK